jgi:hypothetical protein
MFSEEQAASSFKIGNSDSTVHLRYKHYKQDKYSVRLWNYLQGRLSASLLMHFTIPKRLLTGSFDFSFLFVAVVTI